MDTNMHQLEQAWQLLLTQQPGLRIRNAAELLHVSELELQATQIGKGVARLKSDFFQFAQQLPQLGEVMSLARNAHAVHETVGEFAKLKGKFPMGLFLGDQDQRIFFSQWHYGFEVHDKDRLSFQFFDRYGRAIMKIYATKNTDMNAWQQLLGEFVAEDQTPGEQPEPEPEFERFSGDLQGVKSNLVEGWLKMTDVHQFHGLLRKLDLDRQTAFETVDNHLAHSIQTEAIEALIDSAAKMEVPLMMFVANRGVVQIATHQPEKLMRTGPWFNILDKNFNLHLDTTGIHTAWVVRRPTKDGTVTAVEAFDAQGQSIIQFFGQRIEGQEERHDWRRLVDQLETNFNHHVLQAQSH